MVVQVRANSGRIDEHPDVVRFEGGRRTNA
jgi:hypothetical protein